MARGAARPLIDVVQEAFPEIDAAAAILGGTILIDGRIVQNLRSAVQRGAAVTHRPMNPLRGQSKLGAALAFFHVPVTGRVALDIGAAAGGFTRVLLEAGARTVYAVDAGFGQLVGSLRQDPRVVNLEATNVGTLERSLVPDTVEVVSIDVTRLSLTDCVPQLETLDIAVMADLVALVKPQFELHRATTPVDPGDLEHALELAIAGIESAPWQVEGTMPSPVTGARGAREFLVHAHRRTPPDP
jgi:23S rRNA (cytidine1920-2'-O)/16S rRNA (cytidine1409-2'-O)-methyltransferase